MLLRRLLAPTLRDETLNGACPDDVLHQHVLHADLWHPHLWNDEIGNLYQHTVLKVVAVIAGIWVVVAVEDLLIAAVVLFDESLYFGVLNHSFEFEFLVAMELQHTVTDGIANEKRIDMERHGDVWEQAEDDGRNETIVQHSFELSCPAPCDANGSEEDTRKTKNWLRPPKRPLWQP